MARRYNVLRQIGHRRVLDMYSGNQVQRVHWERDEIDDGRRRGAGVDWTTKTISGLAVTVNSDVQFTLNWTNDGVADYTGHKVYLSTDDVTYALNKTVESVGTTTTVTGLTTNTRYYVKVAPYKDADIGTLSSAANDWTAAKIPLAATGTGAGVATVRFWFDTTDVVATLDGNGKFYSDSGGTADESASYTFVAGALRTRYLKVTSGASSMLVFAKGNWLRWGDWTVTSDGWIASTNAPTTSFALSALPMTITHVSIGGNNTSSGSITSRTNLVVVRFSGSTTISGDITSHTLLRMLVFAGSNTVTGSITALSALTYVFLAGSNTIGGDLGLCLATPNLTNNIFNSCAMNTYTAGTVWGNAVITINPSVGYGYDSTEINNILIDMAASPALINRTITLQGSSAARTAASDAAVATLEGVGRTCTVVTNP